MDLNQCQSTKINKNIFFICVFMLLSIKYLNILNIYNHKQVVTSVNSLVEHTTISIDANRPRSTTIDDYQRKSTMIDTNRPI